MSKKKKTKNKVKLKNPTDDRPTWEYVSDRVLDSKRRALSLVAERLLVNMGYVNPYVTFERYEGFGGQRFDTDD